MPSPEERSGLEPEHPHDVPAESAPPKPPSDDDFKRPIEEREREVEEREHGELTEE